MRSRPQREHHVAHATAATRPSNHMLKAISRSDFALLAGELEFVELPLRLHLEEANRPIKHVYFPEAGIASIVANGGHDREIEVGIIGREGMTGLNVVMGNDRSPHSTFIQMEGRGARISADRLRAAMDKSESLRLCFLHFVQAFAVQAAHTALANGRGTVEERLARWMLMAHDRIEGDELAFTASPWRCSIWRARAFCSLRAGRSLSRTAKGSSKWRTGCTARRKPNTGG